MLSPQGFSTAPSELQKGSRLVFLLPGLHCAAAEMDTKQLTLWGNPLAKGTPEQVPTVSMYQPTKPYDDDFPAVQEQV